MTAAPTAATRHTGTSTRAARRAEIRGKAHRAFVTGSSEATRSLSSGGAFGFAARSSFARASCRGSGDDIVLHLRLELLERTGEPRRACCHADPQQAGDRLAVQLEHDAKSHDLALGGRQTREGA